MAGRISLAVMAEVSHEESKTKRDRIRIAHDRISGNGGFKGRAPWGLVTSGPKYAKDLVPTDLAREVVPAAYRMCADGASMSQIAVYLEAETGRKWWEKTVAGMIRNPAYRGSYCDETGREVYRLPESSRLVDAALWKRANASLDVRPKRGQWNPEGRAMLASVAHCLTCGSPMYRIICGSGNQARVAYYRCAGRGPQRKGCGNMVRCDVLDGIVSARMSGDKRDIMRDVLVPGHDHSAEIEEIRFEIRQLALRDLSDDEMDAELARLRAERDRLAALPAVADEWTQEPTGETYAGKWERLTGAGRGNWLRESGIRIWARRDDDAEDGVAMLWSYRATDQEDPHLGLAQMA